MFFWEGELVVADKFDSLNKMIFKNGQFLDVQEIVNFYNYNVTNIKKIDMFTGYFNSEEPTTFLVIQADLEQMNSILIYELSTRVNSIGYVYINLLYSESVFETISSI